MNRLGRIFLLVGVFLIVLSTVALAQTDKPGCKDHPMFTRMANSFIQNCKQREYDQMDFSDEKGRTIKVEGRLYSVEYKIWKRDIPISDLQIARNFQNAIKKIGGVVVYEKIGSNFSYSYLKLIKPEMIYWVVVYSIGGEKYQLTIVEKAAMAQEIVADAKSLMSDIQTKGSASVYGIYFDFDKADIKPESEPTIREIAKLLQENRGLKLYVVGHTDNIGNIDYNLKLSKARADAVVRELVTKYRIQPERLRTFGVASLAPVASNKTEEGRAKNRRVELVEQ